MRTRTLSVLLLAALGPLCAATYNDPQGRFAVEVPSGWRAVPLGPNSVRIASGSGYVTALVFPGSNAAAVVDSVARQMGSQWSGFTPARTGETRLAGRRGTYATYAGRNPKGVEAFLELLGISDGNRTFVLVISAPKAAFAGFRTAFDRMETSFTLKAAAPPPVAAGYQARQTSMERQEQQRREALAPPPKPAATPAAPPKPAQRAAAPAYYRMKKAAVVDQHGFERPMQAMSLLVPVDWQFQGDVRFNTKPGCTLDMVQTTFRAASSDNRFAVEALPARFWQWADDRNLVQSMQMSNQQTARAGGKGCDIAAPMGAADFLRRVVVPAFRRNAQVVAVEPMADFLGKAQEEARRYETQARQAGRQMRIRADAARLRLRYDLNGQPVEEWLTAVTFAGGVPAPSFDMASGRMTQTVMYTCGGYQVYSLRAPQGQLDSRERFFMLMLSTVRADPNWESRINQVKARISADNSRAAMERSAIIRKSGEETSKIIHDTYANRTASQERTSQQFSQYIRGVETYRNPATGETVELSNQYGHAWANGRNEYLLTDSANFNPNVELKDHNWTQLQPVKR